MNHKDSSCMGNSHDTNNRYGSRCWKNSPSSNKSFNARGQGVPGRKKCAKKKKEEEHDTILMIVVRLHVEIIHMQDIFVACIHLVQLFMRPIAVRKMSKLNTE